MPALKGYVTIKEAADKLQVSVENVHSMIRKNQAEAVQPGHDIFITTTELNRLVKERLKLEGKRRCTVCGEVWPMDAEHWYINAQGYIRQPCRKNGCFILKYAQHIPVPDKKLKRARNKPKAKDK